MNMNPFDILASGAAAKPGQVFLANEGSVDNQFLSEALTQYSVGWKSPDGKLEATLRALTGEPIVVPKRFSFKKMDNAKAFASVENDEDVRAIGADFKRVTVQGTTVDSHTVSKGLTMRIDRDELNDNPQAEQDAVAYVRTLLYRGEIIRAFSGLAGAAAGGNATTATWTAIVSIRNSSTGTRILLTTSCLRTILIFISMSLANLSIACALLKFAVTRWLLSSRMLRNSWKWWIPSRVHFRRRLRLRKSWRR